MLSNQWFLMLIDPNLIATYHQLLVWCCTLTWRKGPIEDVRMCRREALDGAVGSAGRCRPQALGPAAARAGATPLRKTATCLPLGRRGESCDVNVTYCLSPLSKPNDLISSRNAVISPFCLNPREGLMTLHTYATYLQASR